MQYLLSVAIPSYNRPTCVIDRLRELFPQLTSEVEVLIIDNASDKNIEEIIIRELPECEKRVSIKRNRANIGLAGNISRCYEYSQGTWTWTLGDDDPIAKDAISNILSRIKKLPSDDNIVGLYFSTSIFIYKTVISLRSLEDYWKLLSDKLAFSNALFISSNVIRTKSYLDNMRIALNANSSYAPHIASSSYAMSQGGVFYCFPDHIIHWQETPVHERWNWSPVVVGMTTLCDIPGCESIISKHLKNGLSYHLPRPFRKTIHDILLSNDSKSLQYWTFFLAKIQNHLTTKLYFQIIVLRIVIRFFRIFPYWHIYTVRKFCTQNNNENNVNNQSRL